jgi:dipeptidyl aminopeptidase/acylaminoacyl peptidase
MKRANIRWAILLLAVLGLGAAPADPPGQPELSLEQIMQDPKWMGSFPGRPYWSEDGKWVYFMWNPEKAESDSLYKVARDGGKPVKVTLEEQRNMPSRYGRYNKKRTLKLYEKNGDLFLLDIRKGRIRQLTSTVEQESDPKFLLDERYIQFERNGNLFVLSLRDGTIRQITDFRKGKKKGEKRLTRQERWLKRQQLELIQVLKKRRDLRELREKRKKKLQPKRPKPIYLGNGKVQSMELSPDGRFVTFRIAYRPKNAKRTIVPNYVTESGFTEDIPSRTKVGAPQTTYRFGIYDTQRDTVYYLDTKQIPGIFDRPAYLRERGKGRKNGASGSGETEKTPREVFINGPYWSPNGKHAVVIILSLDNKDRWIMALDLETAKLRLLDRQHDEAWIGGPGIRGWRTPGNFGWMPDGKRFWFQSEATGYSHLYWVDVVSGEKKQLTSGKFEIYTAKISRNNKYWYLTANLKHPGIRHFYRMPLEGGKLEQITTMDGNNVVAFSPDEKMLAIRYSYANKPWEIYLMPNRPGARARRITHSTSTEFESYPWRDPEIVTFQARDGATVYARLYRPRNPEPGGPAVIFVHGAGYLQNAHKWWSSYFREYMFHNFLADRGYTVLDIDYRGSAGYGRNWRTAIYRHMGGKDLSDQVDGARFLVESCGVDPKRIGIYGGSYGGFITLMAMFREPDVFACGAALRPVTDWAHYNHGYTSNILNVPYEDSLAYVRSSPIYYAEGLKGALLICHGLIDTNVHFQDVVRLVQRLIELKKENWELAIYPLEGHGFREPTSWLDEYRRIFKLFETYLK